MPTMSHYEFHRTLCQMVDAMNCMLGKITLDEYHASWGLENMPLDSIPLSVALYCGFVEKHTTAPDETSVAPASGGASALTESMAPRKVPRAC